MENEEEQVLTAFHSQTGAPSLNLAQHVIHKSPVVERQPNLHFGHLELFLPTTKARQTRRDQPTMAAERKERTGLAVGLNKGHV